MISHVLWLYLNTGRFWLCKKHQILEHKNAKCNKSHNHRSELLWSSRAMPRAGNNQFLNLQSWPFKECNLFINCVIIINNHLWSKLQDSAVKLSNVLYQNIIGTSASEVAIKFDCSRTVPCRGIYLQDVILEPEGSGGTTASCENVRYVNRGKFFPQCSPWRN